MYAYSEWPLILADVRFINRCGHNDVSDVTVSDNRSRAGRKAKMYEKKNARAQRC